MQPTKTLANPAQQDLVTAYIDSGGSAPPVVLVHGFTGSKLDFCDQVEALEDLGRIVAMDQRGHGESSHLRPYNFDQLVDDLMGFLNAINLHRVTLLGHSMGGMVALRAALQHPDWFTSLILMDTSPAPMPVFGSDAQRDAVLNMVNTSGCQALLEGMRGQASSPAQQRGIDHLGEAEYWRRIRTKLTQMDPAAFGELLDVMAAHDVTASLGEINCPTTVIVGAHDTAFVAPSKQLAAEIPDAELVVVDHAAHSPQYENADAWKASVRQHLQKHAP